MRTNIIGIIFRKEIKEVMRDKRMLYLVILLPFFLYPVLFFLIGKVGQNQQEKISKEKVSLLLDPSVQGTPIEQMLSADTAYQIQVKTFSRADLEAEPKSIGIKVEGDYKAGLAANESIRVVLSGDFTSEVVELRKQVIAGLLQKLNQGLLEERLQKLQLPPTFAQPLLVQEEDLSTRSQRINKAIGGYMPMILLLFIFMGCIYIAIDITAGEKERRTLQTLFTSPVHTREIIAGKFLAVSTVGLVSASMNILSLIVAMMMQVKLMGANVNNFQLSVSAEGWLWLILLILLSTVFLASLSLAVCLLANSYKESQSYVSPLMMLVLIPAMLSQMPGMELNISTALIPVFNICLAIASVFKGTITLKWMVVVAFFALIYAFLGLYLASRSFGNESVITGEKVNLKGLLGKQA